MEAKSLSDDVWEVITKTGYLDELKQLWVDVGYDEKSIIERRGSVCGHVQNLFQQMVEEERECKDRLIKKIELNLKEAGILGKELKVVIDLDFEESLPLIAVDEELRNRMHKYQQVKAQRMLRFDTLKEREDELCNALCIKHLPQQISSIPTEEQLQKYEKYLNEKSEDRVRLQEIFRTSRIAIQNIMEELDIKPELDFEELVVSGQTFKLSKENMAALKDLHQSLELRLEDAKASTAELREKLSLLWERLHEPRDVRSAFVSANLGHSVGTLKALKQEINRCEEKKRENIMKFVEEVRQELQAWWDKCYFSKEAQNAFTHFHSNYYSEDLLEMHEREAEKLKHFYKSNVHIFDLIKERQDLWARRALLEHNGQQPDRLFHNRGGELLREEKERKTINKNLPKIEAELMKRVADYEAETGKTFLIFGQGVADYIQNQKEMLEEEKEKEKMARKARNQTDGHQSSVGAKRKGCPPVTPNLTKRGRTVTSASKASATGIVNKASAQRLVRGINSERENRSRQKKVARNVFYATKKTENPKNPEVVQATSDASTVGSNLTYTDFQNYLEKTGVCRSSVKPRHCLRELNTPNTLTIPVSAANRLGTPGKTPVRPVMSLATSAKYSRNVTGIPKLQMPPTPRSTKSPGTNLRSTRLTPARGKLPFLI